MPPPWIVDPNHLSPLLRAYDRKLAAADERIRDLSEGAKALQEKIESLLKENASLSSELRSTTDRIVELTDKNLGNVNVGDDDAQLNADRVFVLSEENDVRRDSNS